MYAMRQEWTDMELAKGGDSSFSISDKPRRIAHNFHPSLHISPYAQPTLFEKMRGSWGADADRSRSPAVGFATASKICAKYSVRR